jgi:hypothetical protein
VSFQKRFGRSYGGFYTYGALSPGQLDNWYITCRQNGDQSVGVGISWGKLIEFMLKDETPESTPKVIASFKHWNPATE